MSGKKAICQFCKFSVNIEEKLRVLAREIQKIKKKTILNEAKAKEISKLPNVEVLKKGANIDTMTFKDTVSKKRLDNVDYIKCDNQLHLEGSGLTLDKFIIHKYYFTCPHFEEAK